MKFFDTENGNILTESELKAEFMELLRIGGTDCKTFAEYVNEVTSKNGTLEKMEG